MDSNQALVSFEHLQRFIAGALPRVGLPDADAERVADLMAQADLQGSDGHGVIRLPQYVKRIPAGSEAPVVLDIATTVAAHGKVKANTGQAILVIDLRAFGDPAAFKAAVDTLVRDIRHSERRPGVVADLAGLAAELGIEPLVA
jgi:LDH2 family malate/lactate/ureidoglycolate dehydrogenase